MTDNEHQPENAENREDGPAVEEQSPQDHAAPSQPSRPPAGPRWALADFSEIPGVSCPCGTARRAFADTDLFPGTIHVTEISLDARRHYHKRLTETYFFLECEPGAQMELDDTRLDVKPGLCVVIPPGVRHRALGRMKVLIVVLPKFDPADEHFD